MLAHAPEKYTGFVSIIIMLALGLLVGCGTPKSRNRPDHVPVQLRVPPKPVLPDQVSELSTPLLDLLDFEGSGPSSLVELSNKNHNDPSEVIATTNVFPPLPNLPLSFDQRTTHRQLSIHALLTVNSEIDAGIVEQDHAAARQSVLVAYWQLELVQRNIRIKTISRPTEIRQL